MARKGEGSPADKKQDRADSKKRGMSLARFEKTPEDKKKDAARMKKRKKK